MLVKTLLVALLSLSATQCFSQGSAATKLMTDAGLCSGAVAYAIKNINFSTEELSDDARSNYRRIAREFLPVVNKWSAGVDECIQKVVRQEITDGYVCVREMITSEADREFWIASLKAAVYLNQQPKSDVRKIVDGVCSAEIF